MRVNPQPLFSRQHTTTLRWLLLVIFSIALMTLDHRQQQLEQIRSMLSILAYPFQVLANLPRVTGGWIDTSLSSRQTLLEQNASMKARQLILDVRLQKMAALEKENTRLRNLLDASFKASSKALIAETMATDLDPFTSRITLNKGSNDQVYVGQPVVDSNGISGQIVHVGPFTSTAMLITDPSHAIPVQVNRNGLRSIALGTGSSNHLKLLNLPTSSDIKENDLLVSSGLGQRFPEGHPVAIVSDIQKTNGQPFLEVYATPVAQPEQTRELLLLWIPEPTKPVVQDECSQAESGCGEIAQTTEETQPQPVQQTTPDE